MQPIIKNFVLFISGFLIGIIAYYLFMPNKEKTIIKDKPVEKVVVKENKQTDTVYVEKTRPSTKSQNEIVNIEQIEDTIFNSNSAEENDSLMTDQLDDLRERLESEINREFQMSKEEQEEEEVIIISERLIKTIKIPLQQNSNDTIPETDLLNIQTTNFSDEMVVEFWDSPLDLTGYQLEKNRLKLFGFNAEEMPTLYVNKSKEDLLQVKIGQIDLELEKTNQFKTLYIK